jgi:hypothetical protein
MWTKGMIHLKKAILKLEATDGLTDRKIGSMMLAVALLLSNAGRDFRYATQPVRRPRLTWPFPVPEERKRRPPR